jgi:hypothetical protein
MGTTTPTSWSRRSHRLRLMDSHKRRRQKRLKVRLGNDSVVNETSQVHIDHKESLPQSRARQYFEQTISRTKLLVGLVVTGLAFLGGYQLLRPHISVDPGLLLNPGDPFTTRFDVKNENAILSVFDLNPSCHTIYVMTDHNVGLEGLPARPAPTIPLIEPVEQTTIDCPSWVGGLGAGTGNILTAFIEIDVSYRQRWRPFAISQRFPFKGAVDFQKGVHWTHITPSELATTLLR